MRDIEHYRVNPGSDPDLRNTPAADDGGLSKDEGREALGHLRDRLQALQELLYADGRRALLVVFQAMDAGGKDSTIRSVFGPLNPRGCRVTGFKAPTDLELAHDFLWRVHANAPRKGTIGVFNRSHYEDVLIVRVKDLVKEERWRARYDHINAFEKLLHDEGTAILKFYLHISKDYQKERLQRRLDRPDKRWKFNPDDLAERERWDDYRRAFEDALGGCSTPWAPWYVIPAERRWFRNLLVSQIVAEALESFDLSYPEPTFDPARIEIT